MPKFGCHRNRPYSRENSDGIFEFADPENPTIHARSVSICCTELKLVPFWLIFAQIWLPWQPPLLPEHQIAYLNSPTRKGCYSREKFLDMLYRTVISAILAYFCPNLVAMATALSPLKIQIAYLNSPTPKTLPYTQKVSRYLVQK